MEVFKRFFLLLCAGTFVDAFSFEKYVLGKIRDETFILKGHICVFDYVSGLSNIFLRSK